MSSIWNLIRQLKTVSREQHIALLLDADLNFAQPDTRSTHKEETK